MVVMVMSFMRMCNGWTCLVGGHVVQVCGEAATILAAVSLVKWCGFFSLATFCSL